MPEGPKTEMGLFFQSFLPAARMMKLFFQGLDAGGDGRVLEQEICRTAFEEKVDFR